MQTIGSNGEDRIPLQEQQNNNSEKKLTGFAAHPENINRNGRPLKNWTWRGLLEEAVEEATKDGKKLKYHMARAMVKEVLKGNVQAFNAIMDRMDGKPAQSVDVTTDGEKIPGPVIYIPQEDE